MSLSRTEAQSEAWAVVKAHAQERLDKLMRDLCSTVMSYETTQVVRGRVAELHELLKLELPPSASEPRQAMPAGEWSSD